MLWVWDNNELRGTISLLKPFLFRKGFTRLDVSYNFLTGNATLFVDRFGAEGFQSDCFDPEVPPSAGSC